MSRLKPLTNSELPENFRKQAQAAEAAGADSTVSRVLAHRADLFDGYFKWYYPMHNGGIVSPALKELVRLKIAALNNCFT